MAQLLPVGVLDNRYLWAALVLPKRTAAGTTTDPEDDAYICIAVHHLIADGWANWVLANDIAEMGPLHSLPPPTIDAELPDKAVDIQYDTVDLANDQHTSARGQSRNHQVLQYWRRKTDLLAGQEYPDLAPLAGVHDFVFAIRNGWLIAEERASQAKVGVSSWIFAAHAVVLQRILEESGQSSGPLVIYTAYGNRTSPVLQKLVCTQIQGAPVIVDPVLPGQSFREFAEYVDWEVLSAARYASRDPGQVDLYGPAWPGPRYKSFFNMLPDGNQELALAEEEFRGNTDDMKVVKPRGSVSRPGYALSTRAGRMGCDLYLNCRISDTFYSMAPLDIVSEFRHVVSTH